MLLEEILNQLADYAPSSGAKPDLTVSRSEFGGLTGNEVLEIVKVAAQVQALEELLTCLGNQPIQGSRYAGLVKTARTLGFSADAIQTLESYEPHLPFFINSLGPHVVNVVDAYFSARHFKAQGRISPEDKDAFFSYYRTSTGTALGIGAFSALNDNPRSDMITEVLKNAIGFKDACTKMMPEHVSFPHLGLLTESTMIGGSVEEALGMAMALGPLLRKEEMPYAEDSIVHLLLGDSSVNEPGLRSMYSMLETHLSFMARHFLKLTPEAMEKARNNPEAQKKLYEALLQDHRIRLVVHVVDNSIGISCKSDVSSPFGDVLNFARHLEALGALKTFEYDGLDFLSTLQHAAKINQAAREHGLVAARIIVPRPGGHSLSNFYGLGMVDPSKGKAPTGSLSIEDVVYHNNHDPLYNALKTLMEVGYLNNDTAQQIIREAQQAVLERLVDLIPQDHPKRKQDLNPTMAYTPETAVENWNVILNGTGNEEKPLIRRARLWKKTNHLAVLSKVPGLGFKVPEEVYLPEHLESVSPLQAENFSLADLLLLFNGNFFAIGEDIPDASPFDLERVLQDPRTGMGGINRQTAKLQVLAHTLNPERGRYSIMDIGINEAGIYALGAGLKHALQDKGVVFVEIQFTDYDFPLFALEEISSLFQRSNGRENIPIIIRHSYGFMRTGDIHAFFEKGGATGMYHSACPIGSLANRYPGLSIVVPNTARAVQMAYRNAVAGATPTLIMMSAPVIRALKMDSFPYHGQYLPLDAPLDPLGTAYVHRAKDKQGNAFPVDAHEHILLTYGEYVPVCSMVADELFKQEGVKTLVVDYNTIVPHDSKLIAKLLEQYRASFIMPKFSIVSQEGKWGFGGVILQDLVSELPSLDQLKIDLLIGAERKGGWLEEHLSHPTPSEVYNHVLDQHQGEERPLYRPASSMQGEHKVILI